MWYGMVWYGMVLCDVVWYGMVSYGMVWYDMVWYGMVLCDVVWYGMVWYYMVTISYHILLHHYCHHNYQLHYISNQQGDISLQNDN